MFNILDMWVWKNLVNARYIDGYGYEKSSQSLTGTPPNFFLASVKEYRTDGRTGETQMPMRSSSGGGG